LNHLKSIQALAKQFGSLVKAHERQKAILNDVMKNLPEAEGEQARALYNSTMKKLERAKNTGKYNEVAESVLSELTKISKDLDAD
jgi:23S rRNA maturation mini-RNase III